MMVRAPPAGMGGPADIRDRGVHVHGRSADHPGSCPGPRPAAPADLGVGAGKDPHPPFLPGHMMAALSLYRGALGCLGALPQVDWQPDCGPLTGGRKRQRRLLHVHPDCRQFLAGVASCRDMVPCCQPAAPCGRCWPLLLKGKYVCESRPSMSALAQPPSIMQAQASIMISPR